MWQALWHLAEHLYAAGFERERRAGDDAADHNDKCDRPVLQEDLAGHEQRERDGADRQRRRIGIVEMAQKVLGAVPESTAMGAGETEQFWQLRAREEQCDAALESEHDRFRDEVNDCARPAE